MEQGTVKWFNADKGFVSFHVSQVTMYSFTSQLSKVTASSHWKKDKLYHSKFNKVTVACKLLTLLSCNNGLKATW